MIDTYERTRAEEALMWEHAAGHAPKRLLAQMVELALDEFERGRPNLALGLLDCLGPERVGRLARECWELLPLGVAMRFLREHPDACRELGEV